MKRRIFCLFLVFCLGLALPACGEQTTTEKTKYTAHSFDYFDTVTSITGYEESQEEFDRVAEEIQRQLGEYHRLYDIYTRYEGLSNLCTVNDLTDGAHATVPVDQKILDLLMFAQDAYEQTDGMVNVAMGSVLKLWHDHRTYGMSHPDEASLPTMDTLQEASRHTDIDQMVIDAANRTVTLTDPQMRLDVGAVAKGYAVERVAKWLEQEGKTGYVLNVGGNVRTVGGKPDDTGWLVGLENPEDTSADHIATLELSGESLVTSGSYQRYYVVDGQSYHHIIHPDTLMPAEGFLSVSVVCDDSGWADALSTALFCMTLEQGKALVESLDGVEVLWVAQDGTQTTSSGWSKYLKK